MKVSDYLRLSLLYVEAAVEEPLCSRYHYEAQTLERVIKAEINVETLRTEIQQIEKKMTMERAQMEEELENLQQSFDSFKNESLQETEQKNTMRQFCTLDSMCSDVDEAECKWLTCKCKPGLSYHHGSKKCVSDCGERGYGRTFQAEIDSLLYGFPTVTKTDVSIQECVNYCIIEKEFTCRTAEYFITKRTCYLSWETLHTNPEAHRSNNNDYILYTRDCQSD